MNNQHGGRILPEYYKSQYLGSLFLQYQRSTFAPMTYGHRLRAARKAKGYTQQQLADVSGVPQGTISKIERGDQDASTYDTILADALSISAIWLTTGKGVMTGDNSYQDSHSTQHMEVKEPGGSEIRADERELVELYRRLSADQQNYVRVSMRALIEQQPATSAGKRIGSNGA